MHFAGVLPEDAPDPRREQAEKLKLMPVPVIGLVAQSSLEDVNLESLAYSQDATGYTDVAASISYTLWRNPDDRSDPINLADLAENTRVRSTRSLRGRGLPGWSSKSSGCDTRFCGRRCGRRGIATTPLSSLLRAECFSNM
jgi:hypothetical protein